MLLRCGLHQVRASKLCVRLCSTEAPARKPTQPTKPTHIIYQILKAKGPLTRNEIEAELSAMGLFDMDGHLARKRLVDNRLAFLRARQLSIPSKRVLVPKGKLQPLLPEAAKKQNVQQQGKEKLNIKDYIEPTREFIRFARVKPLAAFPSTIRIKLALQALRRQNKVQAKPKPGQPAKGRKVFVFKIREGSKPILMPDEYDQTAKKRRWDYNVVHAAEIKSSKLQEKKDAWASYLNGYGPYSSLLDPNILHEREAKRQEKLLGLKA